MSLDPLSLAVAFGGGVLGAAAGGLPAFVLCGLAVIAGTAVSAASGDAGILMNVAWGPFLGPHVAFGGAAAAAAYAARRKRLACGRDVLTPLFGLDAPDVLLVGGIFGILGQALLDLLHAVPDIGGMEWFNRMAAVVVVTGAAARLLFGRSGLTGRPEKGRRWNPENERAAMPWHARPTQVLLIGAAFSLPAAVLALSLPQARGLLFGFAAVSLIFLQSGGKVPVTHHIVLAAELFAIAGGGLWWGLFGGLLAAWIAEFLACLVLIHADTHIDPPAGALAAVWPLPLLLKNAGLLVPNGFVPPAAALLAGIGGFALFTRLRRPR